MSRYEHALWGGRRKEEVDRLQALMPDSGEVPFNPDKLALELFRQFGQAYYDIYNNGAGNWNLKGWMLNNVSRFHNMPVGSIRDILKEVRYRGHCYKLEKLADKLIDEALKEQFGA